MCKDFLRKYRKHVEPVDHSISLTALQKSVDRKMEVDEVLGRTRARIENNHLAEAIRRNALGVDKR